MVSSIGAPNSDSRRCFATSNWSAPTAASTGACSPKSGSRSTCTTPSSSSWVMPVRNCFERLTSVVRRDREVLGREARDRRERHLLVHVERVADAHVVRVDEPDDIAGERLLEGLALLAEHRVGVLGGERLAGAVVGDDHAALETTRADPEEGDAVAVRLVHVGLHLEHEPRERRVERPRRLVVDVGSGRGAGTSSMTASSSSRTPKFVIAEPKNIGVDSPARNSSLVVDRSREQLELLDGVAPGVALLGLGTRRPRRPPRVPRWTRGRCG